MSTSPFAVPVTPNWESLVRCIRRQGTPARVHHIELFLDVEVKDALCRRFDLPVGADRMAGDWDLQREVMLQRWLGYDYVRARLEAVDLPLHRATAADTAGLARAGGRSFQDEHTGPITNWQEYDSFPWPDPNRDEVYRQLEWYERNLPDDMCMIVSGGFAHFCENLTWLMGYETLCYALHDARDLVQAIADRLYVLYDVILRRALQFQRVGIVWGSDDMGFRSGTLISPADLREFVLPGHRRMAALSHAAGRPYLLHACGNIAAIMEDLIADVGIDGKHSFEDTIEQVTDAKATYGQRIALLGGIDMDFLCRATPEQVRERVRRTLEICLPGGGYCLGSGNSVANYVPIENYLAMVDEGRRYRP